MSEDKNCLSYWFPKLQAAGLPVPRTTIIRTDLNLAPLCDGEPVEGFHRLFSEIYATAQSYGFPCFLRTGHTSGKHEWSKTCHLAFPTYSGVAEINQTLTAHIAALVEHSAMCCIIGLPTNVWVVREMLPVKPLYRCKRYKGMPVVPEVRCFVREFDVRYVQAYWPVGALNEGEPDDATWLQHYELDHGVPIGHDLNVVTALASCAGLVVGGDWSVDLLKTDRGWVIIDMAEAKDSWGYDEDRFNGKREMLHTLMEVTGRSTEWKPEPHTFPKADICIENPDVIVKVTRVDGAPADGSRAGGSLLPANNPEILKPLKTKFGVMQVKYVPSRDTHVLMLQPSRPPELVGSECEIAAHPNGYSCHAYAIRIMDGFMEQADKQAEHIRACGGEAMSIAEIEDLLSPE